MAACNRETELRDWVLNELSPEKARELEQHTERCADCTRSQRQLRELQQALMSSLVDQEMPGHLVVVGDRVRNPFAHFWASLARTAALSAAAACIFLAILSLGFAHWKERLLPVKTEQQTALSRADVQTLVTEALNARAALEQKESGSPNGGVASNSGQEQAVKLAQLAQRLRYLEMAQSTVWKQTERQGEVVSLIARNYLQPGMVPPVSSPRR